MARKGSEPAISERSYRLVDGSLSRTYSVRYFDRGGVRRRVSCASREEADFERARIVLEQTRGIVADAAGPGPGAVASITVAEFWPTWLADARSRLTRATALEYERIYRTRVGPRFGSVPLDGIRPRMISEWRADLAQGGVGPEASRRAMMLLQAMFTVAIEWGEATANPVAVVRKPRQGRRRAVAAIAPEAVELLRAELLRRGSPRSAALVSVLAYAGLRPGEALALEVRHVRERTILVEQALSDGELKIQKTGRQYRTVDLLGVLADELRRWMQETGAGDPEALIFPRDDGQAWRTDDWNNWRNRHFYPAAKAAGLGHPRPYDLRHSFASLLIREQRTSIVELAEQLGHAPTMTLNTYAHVFAEHRREEPVDVEEWIARAREAALQPSERPPGRS